MESTVNLSEKTLELHIPIEKWLVQESGGYSIGQLASGAFEEGQMSGFPVLEK